MFHATMRILSVIAVTGALTVVAPLAAAAAMDCGDLNRPRVVQGKNASTTSKSFVDVAGSDLTVTVQDGTCFVVEFSAKLNAPSPQAMRVRVLLDGPPGDHRASNDTVIPASMDFTTTAASDGKATTFIVRNPFGGPRTLRLQFLSVKGGEVTLESWTAIVRYDSGV